jgi:hypothetical protein
MNINTLFVSFTEETKMNINTLSVSHIMGNKYKSTSRAIPAAYKLALLTQLNLYVYTEVYKHTHTHTRECM